jgi:hypothetical protein
VPTGFPLDASTTRPVINARGPCKRADGVTAMANQNAAIANREFTTGL